MKEEFLKILNNYLDARHRPFSHSDSVVKSFQSVFEELTQLNSPCWIASSRLVASLR